MTVCELFCAKCQVVIGETLLLSMDLMTRICWVGNFTGKDKINKYLCISPDILSKSLNVAVGNDCFWSLSKISGWCRSIS